MRTYALRLEEYGISGARYRELYWMCRQYDALKRRAAALRRGEVDRREGGNGHWHMPDPTAAEALRLASIQEAEKVRAIEAAAEAAGPGLSAYILRNVCRGVRVEELGAPCGKNQFFKARRQFFVELDRRV